jgi:hypothetical protein
MMWSARSVLLGIFLLCPLGGCVGPYWAVRVEGRVVDAETGWPIAGARVFRDIRADAFGLGPGFTQVDFASTRTDSDGRFAIPGRFVRGAVVDPWVGLSVYASHPDYGGAAAYLEDGYFRELIISLRRDERALEALRTYDVWHWRERSSSHWDRCWVPMDDPPPED